MGRERMNPAIFGHVQNEPSHTRHHRSSRKEFYWICIDQSKNSRELNNGFSCWWILFFAFFSFSSPFSHYEKMMSKPPTDAIWTAHTTPLNKKRNTENKVELTSLLFTHQNHIENITNGAEKTGDIHFFSFYYIQWVFFWLRAPCGVVRYQTFQTSHGMQRIFFSDFEWRSAMIQ